MDSIYTEDGEQDEGSDSDESVTGAVPQLVQLPCSDMRLPSVWCLQAQTPCRARQTRPGLTL